MMNLSAPNLLSSILFLLGSSLLSFISCDQVTLLTTEGTTTDLKWKVENINESPDSNGWEDLSIPYKDSIVRGYQVCDFNVDPSLVEKPESWLILPGVHIDGASRIFVEVNFTMRECSDLEKTCRETFSVYYQLKDANVLDYNEKFDPTLFSKVDTVAAEVRFSASSPSNSWNSLINSETVSISFPETSKGKLLNVAIVDAGACLALMGVRIYHKVCKETKAGFSIFNETKTGASDTSLVPVAGACVANSIYPQASGSSSEISSSFSMTEPTPTDHEQAGPLYHCTSSGEWQVQTGSCRCKPGYQPDTTKTHCIPCKSRTYKDSIGNHNCIECPDHSSTASIGMTTCQCDSGYSLITREDFTEVQNDCKLCSKLPEPPADLKVDEIHLKDPGSIKITWKRSHDDGGCSKLQYCVFCQYSPLHGENSTIFGDTRNCDHLQFEPSRCHINIPKVTAKRLRGYTAYNFTVIAFTLATKQKYPKIFEIFSPNHKSGKANFTDNEILLNKRMEKLLQVSSTFLLYTTADTLPSGVRNAVITMENQTAVSVKWTEPEFPNGKILFYKVRYSHVYEVAEESEKEHEPPSRYISSDHAWEEKRTNETKILLTNLFPGTRYQIFISAHNYAGSDNNSSPLFAETVSFDENASEKPPNHETFPYLIATIVIATLVVIICLLLVIQWRCRARKKKQASDTVEHPTEFRPYNSRHETLDQRTYVDPFSLDGVPPHRFLCETSPESITCEEVIGCGEFGEVYKGTLATIDLKTGQETTISVAVKQLRDQCEPKEQIDFLREAMSLEKFRHPNIVHLEAVVTKNRPFFILTELMDHGSLHNFLTQSKEKAIAESNGRGWTPLVTHINLAKMLRCVASGMEYLCGRGYVHRDLAARNVLVNSDLTCKVADFGLMREMESNDSEGSSNGCGTYTTRGGKIAIRWTAPEAIAFRTFTQFSDVWSFGILMWEATSFGEKPYWDLTNHEVIKAVTDGMRLPAPEKCPSILHQVMLECWQRDHLKRPTFTSLITKFNRMISEPDVLDVPASPASSGIHDTFFGDEVTPEVEDSHPGSSDSSLSNEESYDDERSSSDGLLTEVVVDRHNVEMEGESSDEESTSTDRDEEEGSEVSSCASTICASEITVCAGNGVVVYVPLLRSDSDEIRSVTPTRNYYSLTR